MNATKRQANALADAIEGDVKIVLLATAMARVEREKIDAIYNGILANGRYFVRRDVSENERQERLLNHKHSYLLCDHDAKDFYARCQFAVDAAGYKLEPGFCPALVAENLQMEAEHALIKAAEPFFPGVTIDKLLCGTKDCGGLETLRKYLDLLIGLVVNRPGFTNPLTGKAVA